MTPRVHLVYFDAFSTRCGRKLPKKIEEQPEEQTGQHKRLRWSTLLDDVTCPRCVQRAFQ